MFIVILSMGIYHEYVGHNFMNNSDVEKTDTIWNTSKLEESSCVTWSVRFDKNVRTHVVDFKHNCNKSVNITYEYNVSSEKWITAYATCSVAKTSYGNPAGVGEINNVKY